MNSGFAPLMLFPLLAPGFSTAAYAQDPVDVRRTVTGPMRSRYGSMYCPRWLDPNGDPPIIAASVSQLRQQREIHITGVNSFAGNIVPFAEQALRALYAGRQLPRTIILRRCLAGPEDNLLRLAENGNRCTLYPTDLQEQCLGPVVTIDLPGVVMNGLWRAKPAE